MLQDSFQIYQIALPVQTGKEGGGVWEDERWWGRMRDGEGRWEENEGGWGRMREDEGGWGRVREDEGGWMRLNMNKKSQYDFDKVNLGNIKYFWFQPIVN